MTIAVGLPARGNRSKPETFSAQTGEASVITGPVTLYSDHADNVVLHDQQPQISSPCDNFSDQIDQKV